MTAKDKQHLIALVCRQAMRGYETLPAVDRIRLLRGLALIAPRSEARLYSHIAFLIQQTEEAQFQLFEQIVNPKPATP